MALTVNSGGAGLAPARVSGRPERVALANNMLYPNDHHIK